jgi:hypothetical protein
METDMKEVALDSREVCKQLIEILNLDPNKMYQSIYVECSIKDLVKVKAETIASREV